MANEKRFEDLNAQELREGVAAWLRSTQPTPPAEPLPPGIKDTDSDKAKETASQCYANAIMAKQPGSWTVEEREYMRWHTNAALKGLGY